MTLCDMVLGALIIIVIYFILQPQINQYMANMYAPPPAAAAPKEGYEGYRRPARTMRPSKSGFTAGQREPDDPYTKINKFIDSARGMRASDLANGALPPWEVPGALERYHQAGATVRPEDIQAADQELWMGGLEESGIAQYNTERAFDGANDAVGYHEVAPLEYNSMITDTVLDTRAVENHRKWAESMIPWAGVSTSPDTLDEALEASVDFIGLRRPQPVAQYNAVQITERDALTFLGNHKFNFQG